MAIAAIKEKIGPFAKDARVNLGNVLSTENNTELSAKQIACVAYASACATQDSFLIEEIQDEFKEELGEEEVSACKTAASVMAMNNVYYRFVHLVGDSEYTSMPAGLRMQAIANPGIDKTTFELCSMAVSALNGCGMCMSSHAKQLVESGVSKKGVQLAVKIASVVQSAKQAMLLS